MEQLIEQSPLIIGGIIFLIGIYIFITSQENGFLAAVASGTVMIPLIAFGSIIIGVVGGFALAGLILTLTDLINWMW